MSKPTFIVIYSKLHHRFEAYVEDGRMISFGTLSAHILGTCVEDRGYVQVGLNSRAGRTILDKINQHSL